MAYLILFLAALLQTTFFPHFDFFGVIPNVVLSVVLLLWYKKSIGLPLVIFSGLVVDLFTGSFIGVNILSLLAVYLMVNSFIGKYIKSNSNMTITLVLVFSTLIFSSLTIAISSIIISNDFQALFGEVENYVTRVFLFEVVYNAVLLNIGLLLFDKFGKKNSKGRIKI